MKRIANYRSGDRAEALGLVLMQSFCAVATVPIRDLAYLVVQPAAAQ